jgi:hypothetical protein
VDELLHGKAGALGWGLTTRPDPNLLTISRFDTLARQYVYAVNGRFGNTGGSAIAIRPPFQIGVQGRLTIGPDRTRDALDALRRGPGGRGGRGGIAPQELVNRIQQMSPNLASYVLDHKDSLSLALSPDQIKDLTALRDSTIGHSQELADTITVEVQKGGPTPDLQRVMQALQPKLQEFAALRRQINDRVQQILTPGQWARLPEAIRNPPGLGGRGVRAGGPGRGGQRP